MATTAHSHQHHGARQSQGVEDTRRLAGLPRGARDPLELLDYRTRRHLISVSEARPGPHLAFESRHGMRLFRLPEGATLIGRAMDAHIRLDSAHISRRHASLTRDGRGTQLLDSRSLNGTWVNGERVVASALRSGDLIEIGPLVARYLELV